MAILTNGVNITQERYEFGVRYPDGNVYPADDFCGAKWLVSHGHGAEIVMRVVYVTPWQETNIEHS
jgi:hypothetical protein